jgi:predicted ArsR family transcriptional regulator
MIRNKANYNHNYPHKYAKMNPMRVDMDAILAGLSSDVWRSATEVAKIIGVSTQRANWILNSLGSQAVERKESCKDGHRGFPRTFWRKR